MSMTSSVSVSPEKPPLLGRRGTDRKSAVFLGLLWLCLALAALFLLFVMIEIIARGVARLDLNLLTRPPSRVRPERRRGRRLPPDSRDAAD